jgi:acetyltransferase
VIPHVAPDSPPPGYPDGGCLDELEFATDAPSVCIRPMAAQDAKALAAMVKAMSAQARYWRFHTGVVELPAAVVERLVRVDPATGIALIATTRGAGATTAVGEARSVAGELGPDSREFALAIADPVQRRGLGERMLRMLIEHAAATGVRHLYGDVLAYNRPMLALAEKLAFTPRTHPSDRRLVRVHRDVPARAHRDREDLRYGPLVN